MLNDKTFFGSQHCQLLIKIENYLIFSFGEI